MRSAREYPARSAFREFLSPEKSERVIKKKKLIPWNPDTDIRARMNPRIS